MSQTAGWNILFINWPSESQTHRNRINMATAKVIKFEVTSVEFLIFQIQAPALRSGFW